VAVLVSVPLPPTEVLPVTALASLTDPDAVAVELPVAVVPVPVVPMLPADEVAMPPAPVTPAMGDVVLVAPTLATESFAGAGLSSEQPTTNPLAATSSAPVRNPTILVCMRILLQD